MKNVHNLMLARSASEAERMRFGLPLIFLAFSAAPLTAADLKAEMNLASDSRMLDTQFGRYGYVPQKTILLDATGARFRVPAVDKGAPQTMLYSYFALAGDFEISATYQLYYLPEPKTGYGITFGIAVDTDGRDGNASFTRGQQVGKGDGYISSRGTAGEGGMKFETNHFPTQEKSGRIVLKREGKELICLAGGSSATGSEICRIPFTTATVRKVRLFADPGGSPTAIDARIGDLSIRAEEITGGIPLRDRGSNWLLWTAAAVLASAGVVTVVIWRKRQAAEED